MPLNNHLRPLWANRGKGYSKHSASAAVIPPPPKGFRRAYYLTTSDHALSNIVFSRLKVARFSELNDPFEVLAFYLDAEDRRRAHVFKEQYDAQNGCVCFSEDWLDPVLWGHYAAKHQGIALGFDLSERWAFRVRYKKGRVGINFEPLLVVTKFESWKYEREWRGVVALSEAVREGNLYFVPMSDKLKLREVILGPHCTLPLNQMKQVVDNHHEDVVTIKSRVANKFFSIVPDEDTVPLYPI